MSQPGTPNQQGDDTAWATSVTTHQQAYHMLESNQLVYLVVEGVS